MPNWVKGVFRARGKKEDILLLVKEGLIGTKLSKDLRKIVDVKAEITEKQDDMVVKYRDCDYIVFNNFHRHFLNPEDGDEIWIRKIDDKENSDWLFADEFKCAWKIDFDQMKETAKKYNVDIRINGFERGLQIEEELEVNRRGEVVYSFSKSYGSYEDYVWNCKMPLLGG